MGQKLRILRRPSKIHKFEVPLRPILGTQISAKLNNVSVNSDNMYSIYIDIFHIRIHVKHDVLCSFNTPRSFRRPVPAERLKNLILVAPRKIVLIFAECI